MLKNNKLHLFLLILVIDGTFIVITCFLSKVLNDSCLMFLAAYIPILTIAWISGSIIAVINAVLLNSFAFVALAIFKRDEFNKNISDFPRILEVIISVLSGYFVGLLKDKIDKLKHEIHLKDAAESEAEILFSRLNQANRDLEMTQKRFQEANKDLQQFVYVASHDLKEPLRTISSYLNLIEKRYKGKIDNDVNEFIEFTVDASQRMQTLINDLVELSRVQTRVRPFQKFKPEEVMDEVLGRLVVLIEESKAEVSYHDLPEITADKSQFSLLLQNLIANGIKFQTPGNSPHIEIYGERQNNGSVIHVKDNGIGIPEEHHRDIFNVFHRLHSKEKYPGTGMGLSICHRIVQRHGGDIWVISNEVTGSEFSFFLPDKKTQDDIPNI